MSDPKLEELIKLAETSTAEETSVPLSEIDLFIATKNLRAGNGRIPTSIVYYIYTEWTKSKPPLTRKMFCKLMRKHFQIKTLAYHRVFMLEPDGWDTSDSMWLNVFRQLRDERQERLKKIYKKKGCKPPIDDPIPWFGTGSKSKK